MFRQVNTMKEAGAVIKARAVSNVGLVVFFGVAFEAKNSEQWAAQKAAENERDKARNVVGS